MIAAKAPFTRDVPRRSILNPIVRASTTDAGYHLVLVTKVHCHPTIITTHDEREDMNTWTSVLASPLCLGDLSIYTCSWASQWARRTAAAEQGTLCPVLHNLLCIEQTDVTLRHSRPSITTLYYTTKDYPHSRLSDRILCKLECIIMITEDGSRATFERCFMNERNVFLMFVSGVCEAEVSSSLGFISTRDYRARPT